MTYAMTYNSQLDWWNQPVNNIHRLSITPHCRSDSIHASEYPLQQQNSECDSEFFAPAHVNDVYQSTQAMPNYWVGDLPQFTETSMPFALLPTQTTPGNYASQCIPSASLPPAAFSKEPLLIDQFSNNDLTAFDNTNPTSFFHSQVLPLSDVPALDYDNVSDENAYGRRQWTDSPMPDEIDSLAGSGETDDSLENTDPCYAELLRQALMEKKDDHTMLLKDLYEWVRTHSSKAQDPSNKGWQNSVRHNLSMNAVGAFPPPNQEAGTKKTSYWRLTKHAVEHGISSTTRYRKDSKRKTQRNPNPAPIRVQAGAKGGQATRRSVRRQQMAASPLSNHSSSFEAARQRNLRRPHQLRQHPITQVDTSPLQQQLPQTLPINTPSYFGNTTEMFNVPNPYPADNNIDDNRDLFGPYCSTQPYLDWSTSPSPMSQPASETSGWRMDQKPFGI
ncbi:unnamed protein product [Aureobasidium vineae]|uniref:Fork-head domain-containing protein n=1 Tax=Aureobasidium vineae TaxID=2773715 RepID=A0A9N8JFT5_9PEZI|nr:unnamed protein product [Aureobasidium vineae]